MRKKIVVVVVFPALCLLYFGHVPGAAAQSSGQKTQPQQASPYALPVAKRDSLLNGLQLIVLEQPGSGRVTVRLRINGGGLFDRTGKGGLADITAGMLLRGGGGLSAKSLSDEVEQLGLTVRITAGWDATDLVISGPADALDSVFDLINHLVIAPAFDQKELDALKAQRIAVVKAASADDLERLQDVAVAELYGSFPYGKPLTGSPESLQQIGRADLQDFYARFYLANNAQLLVQGDVSADQVTRFARARLGTWKKGEIVPPNFRQPEKLIGNHFLLLDRPNATGTHAVVVMPGFSRRAPDYFAAAMAVDIFNQMLAQTGLGLTVKANARILAGPLMIELNAPPDKVLETIKTVNDLMSRMQAQPPTLEQVEAAKGRLISNMAERLRSDTSIADVILDVETYGLGRDYLLRHAERVNAVTPSEIQAAARAYLPSQSMVVAISGPASQLEADAKKAGVVTVLH